MITRPGGILPDPDHKLLLSVESVSSGTSSLVSTIQAKTTVLESNQSGINANLVSTQGQVTQAVAYASGIGTLVTASIQPKATIQESYSSGIGTLAQFLQANGGSIDTGARDYASGIGTLVTTIQTNRTGGLYTAIALYQDQQTSGTNGGTFSSGTWVTRVLNTEVYDPRNIGTLASNQITLQPGTYFIEARAPAYNCSSNQLRIKNKTNDATLITGQSNFSLNPTGVHSMALLDGTTGALSGINVLELQHRCSTTAATFGLGVSNSYGTETYAQVKIYKENV